MILFLVKAQIVSGAMPPPSPTLLAIGELLEIKAPLLQSFSVGSPEVISYKHLKAKEIILIKGKKMGVSELIIWGDKGVKTKHLIYVLSKAKHLKIVHLMEMLRPLGLQLQLHGPALTVGGLIHSQEDLKFLLGLKEQNPKSLILQCDLDPHLKKIFLGEVISLLLKNSLYQFRCRPGKFEILCEMPASPQLDAETKQFLQKNFLVQFVPISPQRGAKNYWVELKVIQAEKMEGGEFSLGLQQIFGSLNDLITKGAKSLILDNKIFLQDQELKITTLTESKISMKLEESSTIEVGQEIPYRTAGGLSAKVIWKFSGLKIDLLLSELAHQLQMKYTVNISKEHGENIRGGKEQSSLLLDLNQPSVLFDIGLWDEAEKKDSLPFLGEIPFLGNLFSEKNHHKVFKKIYGLIEVREKYDDIRP